MTNLNEDVLRHIFDYLTTPLEWLQVSQVCQLWKSAASKQWRKVHVICFEIGIIKLMRPEAANAPVLSAQDAKKMAYFSAPFIKVIRGMIFSKAEDSFVSFGSFMYKIVGMKAEELLKFLAEDATNVSEIRLNAPPPTEVLNLLIAKNELKKVSFGNNEAFYENTPTDGIEESSLTFLNTDNLKSFSGHFPNLKKFELEILIQFPSKPREMLSPILPYIVGLTSFDLFVQCMPPGSLSCKVLLDIARYSQLEELKLQLVEMNVTAVLYFFKKLVQGCSKLRKIYLRGGIQMTEKHVCTLLKLPHLESLAVYTEDLSFQSIELPEMINLSDLELKIGSFEKFNVTSFCDLLKKMPKLTNLRIHSADRHHTSELHTSELLCEVVKVAALQNKNIVIKVNNYWRDLQTLTITRKHVNSSDTVKTLNIKSLFSDSTFLLERAEAFVRYNLYDYSAVVVE